MEKQRIMIAYGAEIVHTPKELGMQGAVAKALELLETIENSITLSQFTNLPNPEAHYLTTGRKFGATSMATSIASYPALVVAAR